MKNATYPNCPIGDCPGTFRTKTSKRGNQYRQCDVCGAFDGARFLTSEERARQKREKAAKKTRKTQKQLLAEYRAERERLVALPQLPVDGWSINDWFPGYEPETVQIELF